MDIFSPKKIYRLQKKKAYEKKLHTIFVLSEMQPKIMMRYCNAPIRLSDSQNADDRQCGPGYRAAETLVHCQGGCQMIQPLWNGVGGFIIKLNILLPHDPTIILLCVSPKDLNTCPQKSCTQEFIAALFVIVKT